MNAIQKKISNILKIKFISGIILFLSFFFFFAIQTSFAYEETDTVLDAVSPDHNLIKHFAKEYDVKKPTDYASINEFMQIVAYFETRIQNDKKNSCYLGGVNTAKGYFQFLDPTYWWIYDVIHNRVDEDFPEGRYIYEYSYKGQAQFAITLWDTMAKRNDYDLKGLWERDYETGYKVYCSFHHTDCDSQLSPTRFAELKDALKNWSKDLYHMTPEKREKIKQERLEESKEKLIEAIKEITQKIEELKEKQENEDDDQNSNESENEDQDSEDNTSEKSRPISSAPDNITSSIKKSELEE